MFNQLSELAAALAPAPLHSTEQINLIVTFQVSTGEWTVDSVGNEYEQTEPVVIKMAVKPYRLPTDTPMAGLDSRSIAVRGRCVEPLALPAAVRTGSRGQGIMKDRVTGSDIACEFVVAVMVPGRYPVIEEALGSKIEGVVQIVGDG